MRQQNGKTAQVTSILRPVPDWQRHALRASLSLALAGLFVWLLAARLADIDPVAVTASVAGISPAQWLLALTFTGISFWAVGHYDAVLHRHFGTGLPETMTRRAGICAIAVSQMLGLGVITGAILRWRMLPGQTLGLATCLTAAVALSFLAGWAVVTACVITALPDAPFKPAASLVLLAAGAVVCLCLAAPRLTGLKTRQPAFHQPAFHQPAFHQPTPRQPTFRWPNSFTLSRLLVLCAIDTLAAAAAFYMLCPPELALPVQVLLPAFLLALGAGLASGTPGGIGAFEITMLGLLPNHPEAGVMGAILAWRITYFAIPAVIGGLIAALGPRGGRQGATNAPSQIALHQSQRAEVQLLRQGEHRLTVTAPAQAWLTARTNHLLVGLFDPIGATAPGHTGLAALRQIAATEGRIAVLYKCTARTAARARRHGQTVQRIAREAWVDPRSFNLATPARAGLRRKLRHATAAGVTITGPADTPAPNLPNPPALHLPLSEMARIAAIWAQTHGGERGFSTGRFAPAYVQGQRLYLAYRQNRLIAFITLHEGHSEWTLDLMRHGTDLPDGTMHLLVQTAIDDARRLDLPRLSLAAVPEHAFAPPTSRLARGLLHLSGGAMTGLARFKSSFAPHWQNLYLTAPHRAGLVVAALSIGRAILAPPSIQPQIEHLHEEYEFATGPGAWQ